MVTGERWRPGLLLAVMGGWYYFGQHNEANEIADEVRGVLVAGDLPPIEQKNLACGYIRAVAQAPTDISLARTLLGYEPRVTFDDGLRRSIDYYRSLVAAG